MGYRKGKDDELKQMAIFLAGKAKDSGLSQEIGPLNPYERRIVHLAVGEVDNLTTESIGDAFEKTVIISVKSGTSGSRCFLPRHYSRDCNAGRRGGLGVVR